MIHARAFSPLGRRPPRAVVLVVGLWLALALACASGQGAPGTVELASIPDGAEAVVTDRPGRRLVGYGRVADGTLRLSVVGHDERDGLVLVLITPDGTFSRLEGMLTDDGITVRDGASERSLDEWLSLRSVTLVLDLDDELGSRSNGSADDRDGEPSGDSEDDAEDDDDDRDDVAGDDDGDDDGDDRDDDDNDDRDDTEDDDDDDDDDGEDEEDDDDDDEDDD